MLRGRGPLRVCPPHVSGVFLCRLVRRAIAEGSHAVSGSIKARYLRTPLARRMVARGSSPHRRHGGRKTGRGVDCLFDEPERSLAQFGRHWRDEWWHEVLRLIAGMVGEKQAGELIAFLMSLNGRSHKLANLMLAAGCLSEVRNRRPIQQQDEALLKRFFEDAIGYDPPYYYEPIQEWNETGPTRAKAVALIASVWRSAAVQSRLSSLANVSQDWIVRRAAVQELARSWKDDPNTLPWLKERARSDKTDAVRIAAVQELARGWKDDADTLPFLQDRVRSDAEDAVRSAAVQELARGWRNDPNTLLWLKERARLRDESLVQRAAVQELARGWKDDPNTLPMLKDRARSDKLIMVRTAAVQELARRWKDDPDVLPLLKEHARSDEQSWVQICAIQELARGWKNDSETLPFLKDHAISDPDNAVRRLAVQELARGWKDDPDTVPFLKDRARSDDRWAGHNALV